MEILDHEDVLNAHDGYISDAQARYDANPTPKNQERLDRAQQDRANSVRDREVLNPRRRRSARRRRSGGWPQ